MEHQVKDIVATFSIVGFDEKTGELGIAVQSKFLGVGAVVPWAKAGVGAIATQALANTAYGPDGLKLLESGLSAEEALDELVKQDKDADHRQAGIVDAKGGTATYTGKSCYDWAGGVEGKHFTAQGNILVGQDTVEAMGKTFLALENEPLGIRLLEALQSGQNAGGDSRGMQSAALLIVKEKGGYAGMNDRAVDLRVDDHPEPIEELDRIYRLQQLYFGRTIEEDILEIKGEVRENVVHALYMLAYLKGQNEFSDHEVDDALIEYLHTENFEEREQAEGKIDKKIYDYLLDQVKDRI